jgi:16S rRNA (adenine1518-N6/adenine1519-N6)-dimethyltransferase
MKINPKKHLGQHFLLDQSIAQRTAELVPQTEDELVLEVGPGTGILTKWLTKLLSC